MLPTTALLKICIFLMNFVIVFSGEIEQLESVLKILDQDYQQGNMTKLEYDYKTALHKFGDGKGRSKPNDIQNFLKKLETDGAVKAMKKLENKWHKYLNIQRKYYNAVENSHRMAVFEHNDLLTEKINKKFENGLISYETGLNDFADKTDEEFRKMNGLIPLNETESVGGRKARQILVRFFEYNPKEKLPASFDWRKRGYVTPVRQQGICGSCYAFAAVAALEAYYKKTTGKLVTLSPQNVVDCTRNLGNNGCNGGSYTRTFIYAKTHGIALESKYPYVGRDNQYCKWHKKIAKVTNRDFLVIKPGDELALKYALVKHGPITVGIDGFKPSFRLYKRGVYSSPDCLDINHAVLLIGYGKSKKYGDYWLVKNSWGTSWGQKGYGYIARNMGNMCRIASQASFPIQ